jgi:ABC-type transport system involved in multi-copper enzyme maturation permease subunit
MLNLIKMDLYRLIRSKAFIIMILVTILATLFFSYAYYVTDSSKDFFQGVQDGMSGTETTSYGITLDANNLKETYTLNDLFKSVTGNAPIVIIITIFASIFVVAEENSGYVKNILGQIPHREFVVFSKLTTVALQLLVVMATSALSTFAFGKLFFNHRFSLGSFGEFMSHFGINYLLCFALCALIVFLSIVMRSKILPIIIGILISAGPISLLYNGVDYLIEKIFYSANETMNFSIANYLPYGCMTSLAKSNAGDDFIRAIIVGVVFSLIFILAVIPIIRKRDVV